MMHYAAGLYSQKKYFPLVGYLNELSKEHDWNTMIGNIQNHIHASNFGFKGELRSKNVKYYNKYATFKDEHTLILTDSKGKTEEVTADKILIAVGLRPLYPDVPGIKECCITSDDFFSYQKSPGRTLIVGASYIALECACVLSELGYPVTVLVRSVLLRGFDGDMAKRVGEALERRHIRFIYKGVPVSFSKGEKEGEIIAKYKLTETGEEKSEVFDTCLIATGREACTNSLGLDKIKVNTAKNGKIIVKPDDQTNVPNIYAIGDCSEGRPELTPPAIQAGKYLARRLFNGATELVDYENIPTTVFTGLEYSHCGLSEEGAIKKYGKENIKVYHSEFVPVYWTYEPENEEKCYLKLCVNTSDNNRVVGLHILSPNAGDVCQGFAVAMKCGLTKEHLDASIGIHPTIAEEFTTLDQVKGEGELKKGGC
jgi:thioredoxin reductase (NADPH)